MGWYGVLCVWKGNLGACAMSLCDWWMHAWEGGCAPGKNKHRGCCLLPAKRGAE
jgi:hypothetical protein